MRLRFNLAWPPTLIAILALCFILEWPALFGPFVFDDFPNLAALDKVSSPIHLQDIGIYLSQARDFPGRPLAMLSFLVQHQDWPDHPFPFKLVNLIIHLICATLVFFLTRSLTHSIASSDTRFNVLRGTNTVALVTTAAWLLHPMQLSTTMLVVQRMTELSALFTLTGLNVYAHALSLRSRGQAYRALCMFLGLGVCTALATLCKENGLLLVVYASVLDISIFRKEVANLTPLLQWLRRFFLYVPITFIIAYLAVNIPTYSHMDQFRPYGLGERLLTESHAIFGYLDQILFPRYGIYTIFHDGYNIIRSPFEPLTTPLILAVLLGSIIYFFFPSDHVSITRMIIGWFLGGHLLESTVVPLELYFEHRNYLPILGPLFGLALACHYAVAKGAPWRLVALSSCAIWFSSCTLATALSAQTWNDADRLSVAWSLADPHSIRAKHYRAERLYLHRDFIGALNSIQESLRAHPSSADAALSEAFLLCVTDRFDLAAYDRLLGTLQAASFERGGFEYIANLQELSQSHQCPQLDDRSWLQLTDALLANPAYAHDKVANGFLHYQRHLLAVRQGQLATAIDELDNVRKVDPDPEIPRLQAKYLESAGLYEQSIELLRNVDYSTLPFIRRLLVNDKAINATIIRRLQEENSVHVLDHG